MTKPETVKYTQNILARIKETGEIITVRCHNLNMWEIVGVDHRYMMSSEIDTSGVSEEGFNGIWIERPGENLTVDNMISHMSAVSRFKEELLRNIVHRDTHTSSDSSSWRVQGRISIKTFNSLLKRYSRTLQCNIRVLNDDSYLISFIA